MGPYAPDELDKINWATASRYFKTWMEDDPTTEAEARALEKLEEERSAEMELMGKAILAHRRLADWPAEATAVLERAMAVSGREPGD